MKAPQTYFYQIYVKMNYDYLIRILNAKFYQYPPTKPDHEQLLAFKNKSK